MTKHPQELKAQSTVSSFALFFFDMKSAIASHPIWTAIVAILLGVPAMLYARKRWVRNRRGGGFFRLDEKNGLLGGFGHGGNVNGKAD